MHCRSRSDLPSPQPEATGVRIPGRQMQRGPEDQAPLRIYLPMRATANRDTPVGTNGRQA